jgi:hypothetical protein
MPSLKTLAWRALFNLATVEVTRFKRSRLLSAWFARFGVHGLQPSVIATLLKVGEVLGAVTRTHLVSGASALAEHDLDSRWDHQHLLVFATRLTAKRNGHRREYGLTGVSTRRISAASRVARCR